MTRAHLRCAFTLVELLVVISIIALLLAMLLPALNNARQVASLLKCSSNLRQIEASDIYYQNDNREWFLPNDRWVWQAAFYTSTAPSAYRWSGYGNSALYRNAHPFKCPLVLKGSPYDGPYMEGVEQITTYEFDSAGTAIYMCVSDYVSGSGLHGANGTVMASPYFTLRRSGELAHSPSVVLAFADTIGGVSRMDYSTFGFAFRHMSWKSGPAAFADGHVATMQLGALPNALAFSRGANNVTHFDDRPYFWW
ncbi:MAG: prepilin-type N-terminal cleavage/methylation domain-containing protein [Phycisphaeraceae bacterium]|nr:prepilin-type N-terminal cleavage/methylation domain-containing protein [Phycisphaeraceae bacterium]